ncbi:MAG: cytidine deaminase [Lachnospiraceae bacterium]|nr:cytidine deaminase [Lachnospiraceae bacterium]
MNYDREGLIAAAKEAMMKAYAPYSNFYVGAAFLMEDGRIYTGCNIENASYGAANCAERTAIFKAISEGRRDFKALALCGGPKGEVGIPCSPCGICRQVLREFCKQDMEVVIAHKDGYETTTVAELLPMSFSLEDW